MSRLSGSVGSSYHRSSSVTTSFPSSSATQSAAIRLGGTRLPSFTGAPGVKSIKRSSQSLPSFVNGSVQHQRIARSTRTTASSSSSISSVMTRSASWSSLSEDGKSPASSTRWDPYHSSSSAVQSTAIAGAPSSVHHQQSAGRTWTTASSSSSIYYPTTKSHSATSANDAMTRSWSSSSTSRQGTGAATSSTTSTRWWMQEDPPSVDGVSTTSTSYTRAVASSRSSYMVPSSGGPRYNDDISANNGSGIVKGGLFFPSDMHICICKFHFKQLRTACSHGMEPGQVVAGTWVRHWLPPVVPPPLPPAATVGVLIQPAVEAASGAQRAATWQGRRRRTRGT